MKNWLNLGAAVSLRNDAVIIDRAQSVPTTTSFTEFDQAVARLARQLRLDHPPATTIGLLGENSVQWIAAFYAILRAGHVAVPISYRQPPSMVQFVVADADVAEIFVADEYAEHVAGCSIKLRSLDLVDVAARDTTPCDAARFRSVVDVDPEQPAMILYTSGSTGKPKGVVLSHQSHLWVVGLGIESLSSDSRVLLSAPLYHMGALSPLQRALAAGQSVVLLPRFDAREALRAIADHGVSVFNAVPPMAALLLQAEDLGSTDLSSVREIVLNSAPASEDLLEQLDQVFNRPRFVFTYGTTESSPIAFTAPDDGRPLPYGSVGVPHPAVQVRLVDSNGTVTSDEGVLELRSPGLMIGYHRRPEIPSPITPDGFYHTKDIFRRDDAGFYYFLGREDDMFICGGENLYPRAIEQVLEAHPAVSQAAVVPVVDPIKGHKPVAFVTLMSGRQTNAAALREHALAHLEPVAHPRSIWFLDELPLSVSNKVDRARLTQEAMMLSSA